MQSPPQLPVKTKLRNILDAREGLQAQEFLELRNAHARGEYVEVLVEACEGYYDVRLENGMEIAALSWYHLIGFYYPSEA